MGKKALKQYEKEFGHWHKKMDFLLGEIENLKKQEGLASLIAAFLLETQYIEFHLQGLIIELELIEDMEHNVTLFSGNNKKKEIYKMSLGDLKDEIKKYEADFLKELKINLENLNEIRVQIAHHIFTYHTSINDLGDMAKSGIEINNKVFYSINEAFHYLDKNSWFGKNLKHKKAKPKIQLISLRKEISKNPLYF